MLGRSLNLSRSVMQNALRNYHGGEPGGNLPFQIKNRYRLTALFMVFFSSGLGLPFFVVRHQLLKQ